MTRYVYRVQNHNELEHFDLSDISKWLSGAQKSAKKLFKPVGDTVSKTANSLGNSLSKIGNSIAKAGTTKNTTNYGEKGKDREWKNHKWVARKRNKDGKWIYDYGDGFPDEKKGSKSEQTKSGKQKIGTKVDNLYKADKNIKLSEPSLLDKAMGFVSNLGQTLFAPSIGENVQGAKNFIGTIKEGYNQAKSSITKLMSKKDSKTGLALKSEKTSKSDDLKSVNPGWENQDGYSQNNCPCCSVAYDMRRRGYEVTAKETARGLTSEQCVSFYKNPKVHTVVADNRDVSPERRGLTKEVTKEMAKEPDGSRGIAFMDWYPGNTGGHMVSYEVENGKVYIYDAQSGEKLKLSEYSDMAISFSYYRTDNLEPDYDQIKKVVN